LQAWAQDPAGQIAETKSPAHEAESAASFAAENLISAHLEEVVLVYVNKVVSELVIAFPRNIGKRKSFAKGAETGNTMFVFDEPTTGLHFHDIKKLLKAFNLLVNRGHTLVVIEHHPDVIKCADWLIDLGPEGGDKGGNLVFQGVPEDILKNKNSYTAACLKDKL